MVSDQPPIGQGDLPLETLEPMSTQTGPTAGPPDAATYDAIGGHEAFEHLVRRFYEGVADDPVLRPLYPEPDLAGAQERLRMFLEQYWGGPRTYSERRGHPRLRMRHAPFRITEEGRDRWLGHMRTALDELGLEPELDRQVWTYLVRAAHMLVNAADEAVTDLGHGRGNLLA